MIELISGDILQANVEALVNPVNTVGVMGKGLALQFKETFPEMFREYRRACNRGDVIVGRMYVYNRGSALEPRYIINFPTKQHWMQRSRMEYIRNGLDALAREVEFLGVRSIAIPPLGCGNGGLYWKHVQPMIEEAMGKVPDVRVLLYAPT